jgi:hypothetical protein
MNNIKNDRSDSNNTNLHTTIHKNKKNNNSIDHINEKQYTIRITRHFLPTIEISCEYYTHDIIENTIKFIRNELHNHNSIIYHIAEEIFMASFHPFRNYNITMKNAREYEYDYCLYKIMKLH